jgi:hypothetical protein
MGVADVVDKKAGLSRAAGARLSREGDSLIELQNNLNVNHDDVDYCDCMCLMQGSHIARIACIQQCMACRMPCDGYVRVYSELLPSHDREVCVLFSCFHISYVVLSLSNTI